MIYESIYYINRNEYMIRTYIHKQTRDTDSNKITKKEEPGERRQVTAKGKENNNNSNNSNDINKNNHYYD